MHDLNKNGPSSAKKNQLNVSQFMSYSLVTDGPTDFLELGFSCMLPPLKLVFLFITLKQLNLFLSYSTSHKVGFPKYNLVSLWPVKVKGLHTGKRFIFHVIYVWNKMVLILEGLRQSMIGSLLRSPPSRLNNVIIPW